jgi:uncharacterized protein involved in type VI secretion and phage assembly
MREQRGVINGIVKAIDKQGRVQVEFRSLPGAPRSAWAPVASAMAGKGRGAFFMPEVEDEVLVAFERGRFDHPFVVGFLWNGEDEPPENESRTRTIKTFAGHVLRFEDGADKQKITIHSSSGHEIVLDDTPAGRSISITTKGRLSLVMDDKSPPGTGSIELRGGGRVLAMRGGSILIT